MCHKDLMLYHWNKNVILTKFSWLAPLEVVILTISGAANDKNIFGSLKTNNMYKLHYIVLIIYFQKHILC